MTLCLCLASKGITSTHMTVRSLGKNQNREGTHQMNIPKREALQLMTNLPFSLLRTHHNTPFKTYQDTYMAKREKINAFWTGG